MSRPEFFPEPDATPDRESKAVFQILMTTITVCFIVGMLVLSWADYRRTEARQQQQLEHFAELFQQSLEASLNVANLKMWEMIEDVAYMPFKLSSNIDAIYGSRLRRAVVEIPQIDAMLILDESGTVIWSSVESSLGLNLSDRAYFQQASKLSQWQFVIGLPITSRATGRRLTPIAWPIISWSGALRGIVASSLGEDYFAELLSLQNFEDDMLVRIVAANGEIAFAADSGHVDSERLLTASHPIEGLGLEVQVSRPRATVMRSYWERTLAFGTISSLLFLAILLSAIRARAQSMMLAIGLKQSERDRLKIETTQREFDAIFENVGDGIVVFDDVGTLHRSNLAARTFLDVSDDEAAVRRLRERLPPLAEIPRQTASYPLNLPHAAELTDQIVQCRVMKLHLYGSDIAYCVLEDISAEERLSGARISFVTSVNHELRTPLTSLSGALDLLRGGFEAQLPANAMKLVNMAARNADRLLVLVNDILTLQAIDQQQLSIQLEQVITSEVLEEAVATNSGYGVGRNVSIVATPLLPDDNAMLLLDRVRSQQIFANLISNAIKYSAPGSEVRVGAKASANAVTFFVSDKGPGIPSTAMDRLFDRFTKPIHNREIQVTGTGLGLAITRELVHRQRGEISVCSRAVADGAKDSGTTFEVTFPRHTSTKEENT